MSKPVYFSKSVQGAALVTLSVITMAVGEYLGLSAEIQMVAKSLLGMGLGWMGYGLRAAKEPLA